MCVSAYITDVYNGCAQNACQENAGPGNDGRKHKTTAIWLRILPRRLACDHLYMTHWTCCDNIRWQIQWENKASSTQRVNGDFLYRACDLTTLDGYAKCDKGDVFPSRNVLNSRCSGHARLFTNTGLFYQCKARSTGRHEGPARSHRDWDHAHFTNSSEHRLYIHCISVSQSKQTVLDGKTETKRRRSPERCTVASQHCASRLPGCRSGPSSTQSVPVPPT